MKKHLRLPKAEKDVILKGAKDAFFRALFSQYTARKINMGLVIDTRTSDWEKVVRVIVHDIYKVEIEVTTTLFSNVFTGTIKIFFHYDESWYPIWRMNYHGIYPDKVANFLRQVLAHTYEQAEFCGCRGVSDGLHDKTYCYCNQWHGEFHSFCGSEQISTRKSNKSLGFVHYQGISLLN